jgi:coenzyme PQQ biosynthesis protein C
VKLRSPQELEAALRDIGARRYHRLHPFHHLLHGGKCTKGQVQAWALNRYYYQAMIPIKDASLIARCLDSDIRREWRRRLVDHDGEKTGEGGIARWLKLTSGLGLDRTYVTSLAASFRRRGSRSTPMCISCVRRYSKPLPPRSRSVLANHHQQAHEGMLKNYKFVTETMAYFQRRRKRARIRLRARLRQRARQNSRAATWCWRRWSSNVTSFGRCWTRSTQPTSTEAASARRIYPGGKINTPYLAAGSFCELT